MISSRFFCALLVGLGLLTGGSVVRAAEGSGWKEIGKQGNLTLYERERAGTSVKEVRAIGTFNSPPWMVRNVLDDVEHYAQFMPYVIQSHMLAHDPAKHTVLAYAQISPPVVDKRDYTVLVHDESKPGAGAGEEIYLSRWEEANDKGPPEKAGFVRVKNNEGSWLLEPIDGGAHTRGTYILWTDGGGSIPTFVLNSLNKRRLTELFEVLSKRVLEPQYRVNKPVLP